MRTSKDKKKKKTSSAIACTRKSADLKKITSLETTGYLTIVKAYILYNVRTANFQKIKTSPAAAHRKLD